ncbi:HAD family hydrolase [Rhizobium sp. Rhizsp82]|uniref:HAD family hydrolase n=1 Tax=Rhizobium sp. Rhizsp82 TaxID=3243057 RepID=UPI0039B6E247
MRILIWATPWATQGGDIFFSLNAFRHHLLKQAQALTDVGCNVTIACPSSFVRYIPRSETKISVIALDEGEALRAAGGWADPSPGLYLGDENKVNSIYRWLETKLPRHIDVVLLWETPTPYFQRLYPSALVISQMPGTFARAPYPHTVVFDPIGLYREGALYKLSSELISRKTPADGLVGDFIDEAKNIFRNYPFKTRDALNKSGSFDRISVLPLQISDHYAFKIDTGFTNQRHYCISALEKIDNRTAVFITEYVSKLYSDRVFDHNFSSFVSDRFPNAIYDPDTLDTPSVTQHLLQFADEAVVATSGIGMQAMIWDLPLKVIGNTHLSPYDQQYVNSPSQRRNILEFELLRHQPLASTVTTGKSLVALIEELHSRKSGKIAERFVDFRDFDPLYEDILMNSFNANDVAKVWPKKWSRASRQDKISQLLDLIGKEKPKLISFDLFDTLVTRGVEQPADLYKLVEEDLRIRGIKVPFDFAQKRLAAEIMAREKAVSDEISLDDIYREFALAEDLSPTETLSFSQREIEIEIALSKVRPLGRDLYDVALSSGVPICVTSDMYLPFACIERILQKSGFDVASIYLSSDIGMTKKSGALFQYISDSLGISTNEIIHIGDNLRTDIQAASEKNLKTLHTPRAVEALWQSERFNPIFSRQAPQASLARSSMVGAIAYRLFDDLDFETRSVSKGDPWRLGYAALGPLIYGFVTWIRKTALEDGIQDLHFLSREGKILMDAFNEIDRHSPSGIRTNYLWGSRRAIRVAQLDKLSDILELSKQTIDKTATLATLLKSRFGIDAASIDREIIRKSGFNSAVDRISTSPDHSVKLTKLLTMIKDDILSAARSEGKTYREYLDASGLNTDRKAAVVDIGWHGNMQGSLGQLLGKPLTGYYFATLEACTRWRAEGHTMRGYYVEDCSITTDKPLLANRLMLEHMMCDVTPSITSVEKFSEGFRPVYSHETADGRRATIAAMQAGALKLVSDICKTLGDLRYHVDFKSDVTLPVLESILANPHPEDALFFIGHSIEDSFSGANARYFIATGKREGSFNVKGSYWRAGAAALSTAEAGEFGWSRVKRNKIIARSLRILVRPFVSLIGDPMDCVKFDLDPASFFKNLKNPRYQKIGKILFGT